MLNNVEGSRVYRVEYRHQQFVEQIIGVNMAKTGGSRTVYRD